MVPSILHTLARATRPALAVVVFAAVSVAIFAERNAQAAIPAPAATTGTVLKPPVTIKGTSKSDLLKITASGVSGGGAISATSQGTIAAASFNDYGSGPAVSAAGALGDGVDASTSGSGVNALSAVASGPNAIALSATAFSGLGLSVASAGNSAGNVVSVTDTAANALLVLDKNGNLTIRGTLTTKSTFDRPGTATLVRGEARVAFERETISGLAGRRYAVFLTPLGDGPNLYVADKTASGFEVRESGGGRVSMGFDYRVMTL